MTIVTKTIIGIDYSLTSPAICVNIDGDAGLMFYYLTSTLMTLVVIAGRAQGTNSEPAR